MNYFSQELGRLIANPYITYPPGRLRPAILQNKTQRLRLRQKELRKLTENNVVSVTLLHELQSFRMDLSGIHRRDSHHRK